MDEDAPRIETIGANSAQFRPRYGGQDTVVRLAGGARLDSVPVVSLMIGSRTSTASGTQSSAMLGVDDVRLLREMCDRAIKDLEWAASLPAPSAFPPPRTALPPFRGQHG